jgi:SAM-dependent methyltransferase
MNDKTAVSSPAKSEQSPHDKLAETYRTGFALVTNHAIPALLDGVKAGAGVRLLDVACGPGDLAGAAAARGAKATGVDLASGMVSVAAREFPAADFRVAGADALPFEDASFDALVCSFGVGQFSDAEAFAAECARLLKPGGRAALTWWQGYDRNRINGLFYQVLVELGVTEPPPDKYGNAERIAGLLKMAGCDGIEIRDFAFEHRLPDAESYWQLAMGSFGRIAKLYDAQDEATKARIRTGVEAALAKHANANGLSIPIAYRIATGTRRASA